MLGLAVPSAAGTGTAYFHQLTARRLQLSARSCSVLKHTVLNSIDERLGDRYGAHVRVSRDLYATHCHIGAKYRFLSASEVA